jgi:hypothetical protein
MIHKTLHRKLKIEKNKPTKKPGVKSVAPKGILQFYIRLCLDNKEATWACRNMAH